MSGRARSRFAGDVAALTGRLARHAKVPDFIRYSEDLKSRADKSKILEANEFWKDIYAENPNLFFSQRSAEQLFEILEEHATAFWPRPLTAQESGEWRQSMSRRIRAMARHINNARAKKASWVGQLGIVVERVEKEGLRGASEERKRPSARDRREKASEGRGEERKRPSACDRRAKACEGGGGERKRPAARDRRAKACEGPSEAEADAE